MRIYLDDVRDCPDGWTLCRTANKLLFDYINSYAIIEEISFDHDLGENEPTGYDLLKWIEEHFANGHYYGLRNTKFTVHSANPVGRKNMEAAIHSIERLRQHA